MSGLWYRGGALLLGWALLQAGRAAVLVRLDWRGFALVLRAAPSLACKDGSRVHKLMGRRVCTD